MNEQRKLISHFVKRAYLAYFEVKLGDEDKPWARTCTKRKKYFNTTLFLIQILLKSVYLWRRMKLNCTRCDKSDFRIEFINEFVNSNYLFSKIISQIHYLMSKILNLCHHVPLITIMRSG